MQLHPGSRMPPLFYRHETVTVQEPDMSAITNQEADNDLRTYIRAMAEPSGDGSGYGDGRG